MSIPSCACNAAKTAAICVPFNDRSLVLGICEACRTDPFWMHGRTDEPCGLGKVAVGGSMLGGSGMDGLAHAIPRECRGIRQEAVPARMISPKGGRPAAGPAGIAGCLGCGEKTACPTAGDGA